ncbi:MAG: DUF4345 domain-containing protein [Proteobacteria bacterium]|nr:DUF4345 domain-containing protein [Pseudomonadota bacterium]
MSRSLLEKRALQLAVAIAATLPVAAGTWDVLHGVHGAGAWALNHERYLSGLLLAIGLGFWSSIPDIERRTGRFRLLTFVVAVGGLCRLIGVLLGDPLSPPVILALAMELVVTPVICLWQARFALPAIRTAALATFRPQSLS